MSILYEEMRVPSSDGIHTLTGRVYRPEGRVRGLFHVVHGMTEHIARYDPLFRRMAEDGYLCFGYDHLGHGATARDAGELGYIADRDGWRRLAQDVAVFADAVERRYAALWAGEECPPYFLMGHSMGSFIVRTTAYLYRKPDRLIVMGTGGRNPASGIGLAIIRLIRLFRGGHAVSPTVDKLAFSGYNKKFAAEQDPYAWLTRDRAARDVYRADPLCTFKFSLSAMQDLVTLNRVSNSGKCLDSLAAGCPILLLSGDSDPVGGYGRGVTDVYNRLRGRGADVRMKLYPGGRHEILNDSCRDEVIGDIRNFLDCQ